MKYPRFTVAKTYGHDLGLSCCFRQWRAESHCRFLHGYAIAVKLEVVAEQLNKQNWAFDFGDFKEIKAFLVETFDHRLIIAEDDPMKDELCGLAGLGAADALVLPNVGCEAFALYVHSVVAPIISRKTNGRAKLASVTILEHGANAVTYSTPV